MPAPMGTVRVVTIAPVGMPAHAAHAPEKRQPPARRSKPTVTSAPVTDAHVAQTAAVAPTAPASLSI